MFYFGHNGKKFTISYKLIFKKKCNRLPWKRLLPFDAFIYEMQPYMTPMKCIVLPKNVFKGVTSLQLQHFLNIFQVDLPLQVGEASVSIYPNHHQVYVASHTSEKVVKNLVKDGERSTQWYKDNLLQVNCDKYQCMLLGCENSKEEKLTLMSIN